MCRRDFTGAELTRARSERADLSKTWLPILCLGLHRLPVNQAAMLRIGWRGQTDSMHVCLTRCRYATQTCHQ